MMKRFAILPLLFLGLAVLIAACSSPAKRDSDDTSLSPKAAKAVKLFTDHSPTIAEHIDAAYGFAIFPRIIKGGLVIGGAHGAGEVYQDGAFIGASKMTMATIGFQIGGQGFAELILFDSEAALNRFKGSKFEFAAQATAVALRTGVSFDVKYRRGVAVFTIGTEGLMAEVAAGGQKFTFTPR